MPVKRLFKIAITFSAGMIVFCSIILFKPQMFSKLVASGRSPASVDRDESKWAVLNPPSQDKRWQLGKAKSSVLVEVIRVETTPIQVGEAFTLHGRMHVARDYPKLEWTWTLPAGVTLVSGQLHGQELNVEALGTVETEITVVADREENRQIHLHAYELRDNERFGDVAQFNTVIAAAPETTAQASAQREPDASTGDAKASTLSTKSVHQEPVHKHRLIQ